MNLMDFPPSGMATVQLANLPVCTNISLRKEPPMTEDKSTHLTISIPSYDGPFDVLISLIRRNEWSIDDLPILEITRQFLEYIRLAKNDMDAGLGGEFIETASWLVLLKSRSLLPVEQSYGPAPQEELRRALVDNETLAAAAGFLRERSRGQLHPTSGGAPGGRRDAVLPPANNGPSLQDVLKAAAEALASARAAASFQSTEAHNITVEDQLRWISARLCALPVFTPVSTVSWFDEQPTPAARIALFLALLELARQGFLLVHQAGDFTAICVKALREIPRELELDPSAFIPVEANAV
jgi:segregation and condensation protein A